MIKIIGHICTPVYLLFKPFTFFAISNCTIGLDVIDASYFWQGGIWKTWTLLKTFINKVDAGPPLNALITTMWRILSEQFFLLPHLWYKVTNILEWCHVENLPLPMSCGSGCLVNAWFGQVAVPNPNPSLLHHMGKIEALILMPGAMY